MKILVSGYYGYDNAGDELILESILNGLRTKKDGAEITILSANPCKTSAVHGVRAVDRWNWFKLLREIQRCDILITGGGGLFQDFTGNLSLYYYLGILLLARFFNRKAFVYGVGINDLRKMNRALTVAALKGASRITVRENFSRDMLISWGLPAEKIEVTADPVLLKEVKRRPLRASEPRIAFVLRPPRSGKWPIETFASLADSLNQRLRARVTFIPFHLDHDMDFTKSVMRAMRTPAHFIHWKGLNELHGSLDDVDLIVSQRLHALILGALRGVPLVGISEDPKIARFMCELGQKNIARLSEVPVSSLLAVILDIWEWREDSRKNSEKLLPAFRARARRSNELLLTELANL